MGKQLMIMNGSSNAAYTQKQSQKEDGLQSEGLKINMSMSVFYNPILLRGIDVKMLISCVFLFKKLTLKLHCQPEC